LRRRVIDAGDAVKTGVAVTAIDVGADDAIAEETRRARTAAKSVFGGGQVAALHLRIAGLVSAAVDVDAGFAVAFEAGWTRATGKAAGHVGALHARKARIRLARRRRASWVGARKVCIREYGNVWVSGVLAAGDSRR